MDAAPPHADMTANRYAPEVAFPPYAFLPGVDPHPTRDPQGHSYSEEPEAPAAFVPSERWRENELYLLGADLYNHGYLWEAHEAWEGVWHPSKRDPLQADHLQGLIQCAAACLKVPMGQPRGLERLTQNGTEKLERVGRESGGTYMGVELFEFVAEVRRFAASNPEDVGGRPVLVLDIDGVEPPQGRIAPRRG